MDPEFWVQIVGMMMGMKRHPVQGQIQGFVGQTLDQEDESTENCTPNRWTP